MSVNNKTKTVLFYGMSGAGKGTQSKLLLEKLSDIGDTKFVEVGGSLRKYVSNYDTYGSEKIKDTMAQGKLLPPAVASYMWTDALLNDVNSGDNLIIDGAARSVDEAKLFSGIMDWLERDYVIFVLEIDVETAIQRAITRGEGRADDNEEAMERRLAWFREQTMPAIEYMKERGAEVHIINGSETIEEVKENIWNKLDLK